MRIALLTLESAASREATARFAARHAGRLALVALSPPLGAWRSGWRALRRGGPGLLPWLLLNHALPALRPSPLARLCRARGIPLHALGDDAATARALRGSGAELLVSFHLDRILPPALLAAAPRGGVNVHPSLLPRHRGPMPAFHGLAEGATGVSIHALTPRVDAGGVWAQRAVPLPPGTSATAAARALHLAALPLLDAVLARIAAGEAAPPAPEPLPYAPWPGPAARRRAGVPLVAAADWRLAWEKPGHA
ncbi:formyltransferase family protein [Roseococcus sp. DSY-14]|uniref:formyltransferase family protein n=1 Tax=Roseococcus sp. DSY-14 TaxID=3369650 RepID=UPI00387B1E9E